MYGLMSLSVQPTRQSPRELRINQEFHRTTVCTLRDMRPGGRILRGTLAKTPWKTLKQRFQGGYRRDAKNDTIPNHKPKGLKLFYEPEGEP